MISDVEIAQHNLSDLVFHKSLPVRRSEFSELVAALVEAAKQEEREAMAGLIQLAESKYRSQASNTFTTT